MNMTGHDNYQQVYVDERCISGGARSNKRLFMIRLGGIENKRVLDIGCNAGMLAIEAKKRGASYVMGVERGPVINVAKRVAQEKGIDVDFRQMDMESPEFMKIAKEGNFDYVFFCAMYDHVKPENRTKYVHFLDGLANEVLIFETNFERNPDPYLEILNKYTTFDKVLDCGETGDRKPSDYHMYRFERHRNEPYEVKYLPVIEAPMSTVFSLVAFEAAKNQLHIEKVKRIKDSIAINGQVRPCLVTAYHEDGYNWRIKEGGHRYLALAELGIQTIKIRDITGKVFAKRTDV